MKTLLIIILLFTFSSTTYAKVTCIETGEELTMLQTTDGWMAFTEKMSINIANLRSHTVIIMLQKDGYAYRGAGIAIDKRHILTVNHAAATTPGSNNYYFSEENGKPYDAIVIKNDPTHDLALLEIDKNAPDLIEPMTFNNPISGETIYTIGHPLQGLYSLTMGETSNNSGRLKMKINEGNSGGFVMNDNGELVGMITSKQGQVGNLAYMIGKDDIMKFMEVE